MRPIVAMAKISPRESNLLSNIQNIVGTINLRLPADSKSDLEALHEENCVFCTYQKNMLLGLIFLPLNSPVVLLIFTSCKILLTGAKSCRLMRQGWKDHWPLISKCITTKKAESLLTLTDENTARGDGTAAIEKTGLSLDGY